MMEKYKQIKSETIGWYIVEYVTIPDEEPIIMLLINKETGEVLMPVHVLSNFLGYDSPDEMLAEDTWLDILSSMQKQNVDKEFPLRNGSIVMKHFHWKNPKPQPE